MGVKRPTIHTSFGNVINGTSLWENVYDVVKDILGYSVPEECKGMYLGDTNDHVMANLARTCNWYKIEPPSIEQWVEIYILEKMTYQIRLRDNVFVSGENGRDMTP